MCVANKPVLASGSWQHLGRRHIHARCVLVGQQQVAKASDLQYGGCCTKCRNGQHWLLANEEAITAAADLMQTINEHQRLDLCSNPPDPRFHINMLLSDGPGRMLGVMVCSDAQGNKRVLKAFSGQIGEDWYIPGWVGPVAGITSRHAFYLELRRVTEQLSSKIVRNKQLLHQAQHTVLATEQSKRDLRIVGTQTHTTNVQRQRHPPSGPGLGDESLKFLTSQTQLLTARRRGISHHLLKQIQLSYQTHDRLGRPLSLLDVYLEYSAQHKPCSTTKLGTFTGFPAGTGDCCAPKLLHAAAIDGLTPLSLVEFWYGSAPGTGTKAKAGRTVDMTAVDSTRVHQQFYGMCDKCTAILGTMLCGNGGM